MVTRRTVLTTSAGVALTAGAAAAVSMLTGTSGAAIWTDAAGPGNLEPTPQPTPSPSPSAGAAAPRAVPRTIAARADVTAGRLRVTKSEFGLSHLGVAWSGAPAQVRVSTAAGWSGWQTVQDCGCGRDGVTDLPANTVLTVPGATGFDVSGAARVVQFNTVDGPVRTQAAAVAAGVPLIDGTTVPVPYLSRAAWGADESLRFKNGVEFWPPEYYPTQTLTVHHTAGANNDPNPAATVRAIYHDQAIVRDWGDIGYHFMIDQAGQVYQGRYTGTSALPGFWPQVGVDGRPLMGVGAHVKGYNAGNVGICLMGDLTSQQPTAAARNSLVLLLAGLWRVCRLNPLGTTAYVDPVSGASRTGATISGHRDWAATACPGDAFYPNLRSVVADAAQIIGPAPRTSPPRASTAATRPPLEPPTGIPTGPPSTLEPVPGAPPRQH
jgi:hypothetical protein